MSRPVAEFYLRVSVSLFLSVFVLNVSVQVYGLMHLL